MSGGRVNKPVECVTCLDRIITSEIQRYVATQAPVHIHDFPFRYFEAFRNCLDLIRSKIAIVESRNRALCGYLNQGPRAQDIFLYGSFDPPHGIGGKTNPALWIEAPYRLHQANIS